MKKLKGLIRITTVFMFSLTLFLSSTKVFASGADESAAIKTDGKGYDLLAGEEVNPRLKGILLTERVANNVPSGGYESPRVQLSPIYSNDISITFQNTKMSAVTLTLYKSDTPITGQPGTKITSWNVAGGRTTELKYRVSDADRIKYLYIHIVPSGLETRVSGLFNWIQK